MKRTEFERRSEERFPVRLPIELGWVKGVTRDVSVSGLYFEVSTAPAIGEEIDLKVFVDTTEGQLIQRCRGHIVRVDRSEGKTGIAVKVTDSIMEHAPTDF